MRIRQIRHWLRLVYLLFLVAALTILYQRYSLPPLPQQLNWGPLVVAGIGQIAFWWLYAAIWRYLVRILTGCDMPMRVAWGHCALMSIGKYLPGKIWGLLGRGVALVDLGASPAQSLGVAYIEQLLFIHSGMLIGLLAFVWAKPIGLIPLFAGVAALASIPLAARWGDSIYRFVSRYTITGMEIPPHWDWCFGRYLSVLGAFTLLWSLAGIIFAALYFAFYPFDLALLPILVTANATALILGFLAFFAPAGIGIREAIIVAIAGGATPLGGATVLAAVYRAWTLTTDAFSGVIALLLQWPGQSEKGVGSKD